MSPRILLRPMLMVLLLSFCLVNLIVLVIVRNQSDRNFLSLPTIFGQAFVDDLSDYEDWQYSNNELDGCYHVFIDVGSNIGNTVRNTFHYLLSQSLGEQNTINRSAYSGKK